MLICNIQNSYKSNIYFYLRFRDIGMCKLGQGGLKCTNYCLIFIFLYLCLT